MLVMCNDSGETTWVIYNWEMDEEALSYSILAVHFAYPLTIILIRTSSPISLSSARVS